MSFRTPIVSVLGHVDHGKTTLLDTIQDKNNRTLTDEAGSITQHVNAIEVSIDEIENQFETQLPGLLFIDTPGHRSFSSLRSQGGVVSDIVIVVIDIQDGIQQQTRESIEFLAESKTSFIIAANKIDTIPGWQSNKNDSIQTVLNKQPDRIQERVTESIYEIIGNLSERDINSNFFRDVSDFSNTVGIVPTSAKTGEGIPELLSVALGLSEKYLSDSLEVDVDAPGEGFVLDITSRKGYGQVANILLYSGHLSEGDEITFPAKNGHVTTTIRTFTTRDSKQVTAAACLQVSGECVEDMIPGTVFKQGDTPIDSNSPLEAINTTGDQGVVVKADTLGSLDAVLTELEDLNIDVAQCGVGSVKKKDVLVADTNPDPWQRVILGFNVDETKSARGALDQADVRVVKDNVIYQLIEQYEELDGQLRAENLEELLEIQYYYVNIFCPHHIIKSQKLKRAWL